MTPRHLTPAELRLTDRNLCPHCRTETLVCGPRGGAAVNVECSTCGCRMNLADIDVPIAFGQMLREPPRYVPPRESARVVFYGEGWRSALRRLFYRVTR